MQYFITLILKSSTGNNYSHGAPAIKSTAVVAAVIVIITIISMCVVNSSNIFNGSNSFTPVPQIKLHTGQIYLPAQKDTRIKEVSH